MNLTVVYDNEASGAFEASWGFSCLITSGSSRLLFDTGWDGAMLARNLSRVPVEAGELSHIIISHEHWDHLGGLAHLLPGDARTVVPASFSKALKKEIRERSGLLEITGRQELAPDVYSLGELGKEVKEQSLGLVTGRGVVVLTGCAHPGLDAILEAARSLGPLHGLIGGFHGFDQIDRLSELSLIVPCHCTRKKQEILTGYPETSRMGMAGLTISLD